MNDQMTARIDCAATTHLARSVSRAAVYRLAAALLGGLAAGLSALAAGPNPAMAQQRPSTMIVFDGSGSMWGRLAGSDTSKYAAARQLLMAELGALSSKPNVGVVVFGQKSQGGCTSSEVLLQPTPYDGAKLADALGRLNPQGRGPLVRGLETAVQALAAAPGQHNIIVIHDDPDNCDRNVCQAVRGLQQTLPDLRISTLSLMPKDQDRGAMACLAKATNGKVFEVDSLDEAAAAVRFMVAALEPTAHQRVRPVQPRPAAGPQTTPTTRPGPAAISPSLAHPSPGLMLSATLAPNGQPLRHGLIWKIERLGDNRPELVHQTTKPSPAVKLRPGRYAVALYATGVSERFEIEVAQGQATRKQVILNRAAIRLAAVLDDGGAVVEDTHFEISTVHDTSSGPIWAGLAPRAPLLLPAGDYKFVATAGRTKRSGSFRADVGRTTAVTVPLKAGYLNVRTGLQAQHAERTPVIKVETDAPGSASGRRTVALTALTDPNFLLPAGTYYVNVDNGHSQTERLVAVAAGKVVEARFAVTTMQLGFVAKLRGAEAVLTSGVRYRIWSLRANATPPLTSNVAQPEFALTPGHYRVECRIGNQNAVVVRDFEVGSAPKGRITLEFDVGTVSLTVDDQTNDVYWQIRDQTGRTVWRSVEPAPKMALKSGHYTVIAEIGNDRTQSQISVESGQHIAIELQRK